jgi:uncharacterized protein
VSADLVLIGSATLLGLAATPHCAAMCGAPCAAVLGRGGNKPLWVFLGSRLFGYASVGAVAAASVGALAVIANSSPALRPLWLMLHAALMVLGAHLLWRGQQPAWLAAFGRVPLVATGAQPVVILGPRRMGRAAAAGVAWVAWPCGLLQSALLVASLTSGALAGAAAMAGFALASSAGLVLAPWLWRRLGAGAQAPLVRVAGALLIVGSLFTISAGAWQRVAAWCGLG